MRSRTAALAAGLLLILPGVVEARPLRVMTLDQCADQYALALIPDAELALSHRSRSQDAWLRAEAEGRRIVRPTLEAAIGFKPDVVIRYWSGEPRMLAALEARGVRVLSIEDANDMAGVETNIRHVAAGLNRERSGQALIDQMRRTLDRARRPARSDRTALYMTPGGFTAGKGTLIDAIFRAAGYANLAGPGYSAISVERIALSPPVRFVLGFFEQARGDWRGPGRHPVVRRAARGRTVATLPATALTCPGWFAADAALMLAEQAE